MLARGILWQETVTLAWTQPVFAALAGLGWPGLGWVWWRVSIFPGSIGLPSRPTLLCCCCPPCGFDVESLLPTQEMKGVDKMLKSTFSFQMTAEALVGPVTCR